MKLLVTGGAGFLGKKIAYYFSKKGYEVIGCGRGNLSVLEQAEIGFMQWYKGTLNKSLLTQIECIPDVVIHCAGGGSVANAAKYPQDDYYSTVESTKILLEYVREHWPIAKFIYPSSPAVYGACNSQAISISLPTAPISIYGTHKLMAENYCEFYKNIYGINIYIIRLFSVYGIGLEKQILWEACSKFRDKKKAEFWGNGNETRDFIHIKDVLELFDLVINSNIKNYPYKMNCGSGSQYKIKNIISMLRDYYHYTGEISFNNQVRIEDPRHYLSDNTESYRYGWKPKEDLNLGLEGYVTWFKSIV